VLESRGAVAQSNILFSEVTDENGELHKPNEVLK